MSDICQCYKKYDIPRYGCDGYCIGTKECEPCTCQGKKPCAISIQKSVAKQWGRKR